MSLELSKMSFNDFDLEESLKMDRQIDGTQVPAWPDPEPIAESLQPVQAFNADLLPYSLRDWVVDITERMQCPIDYPAVGVMAALSTVIGRKIAICPKQYDDWTVVCNLWGMLVGRPSSLKTPSLTEALKPLRNLEAEAKES